MIGRDWRPFAGRQPQGRIAPNFTCRRMAEARQLGYSVFHILRLRIPSANSRVANNSAMLEDGCSSMKKSICSLSIILLALSFGGASLWSRNATGAATNTPADPLATAMAGELERAKAGLAKSDPAPYYISYSVYDEDMIAIAASLGSILTSARVHQRPGDVMVRVGDAALDNTHKENLQSAISSGFLPIDDNSDAAVRFLWELTNREYRQAAPAFLNVKAENTVQAEEEDKSPDFSVEQPQVHLESATPNFTVDQKSWEGKVRRYSAGFRKYPEVYYSNVFFQAQRTRWYFTSTEGTQLLQPSSMLRLIIQASTRADDGMDLMRVESFEAPSPDGLPADTEILRRADKMAADLSALRKAPVQEAFNGPALLSGRAAAVFFHEVLGHRLEGHRQKDENEGQTFTKKMGQPDSAQVPEHC